MNGKQLKNSILQWAIQGKLVPQDPNDEPASVLLERIREEKARLVKEKKIKKDKNESIIYRGDDNSHYEKFLASGEVKCIDEEIPFEIPEGWSWARGRHIFLPMQSTKPKGEYFTYIDIDAVNNKANIVDKPKRLPCSQAPSRATRKLEQNCILFSMVRPYLKNIALIGYEHKDAIASTGFYVIRPCSVLYPQYIFKLLLSAYVVDGLNQYMKGDNSPSINNEHIESYLYPIPPYGEQSRIVEKLDDILPIAAKYEGSQSELDKLNTQLYERLKKSILQEAIQGKLAAQDLNDEPASVLLERIREEKQRLLKEGKLKRKDITDTIIFKGEDNKYYEQIGKETTCIDDEIPFDIPKTWSWIRLGHIFQHNTGKALNGSNQRGTPYEYITTSNLYWNRFVLEKLRQMPFTDDELDKCTVKKGDLLVCEGGDIGRSAIWNYDNDIRIQNHIHRLRAYVPVCTKFFYYTLYLYKRIGLIGGKGIGIQGLSSNALHNLLLPLPPVKEQQRISESIANLSSKLK